MINKKSLILSLSLVFCFCFFSLSVLADEDVEESCADGCTWSAIQCINIEEIQWIPCENAPETCKNIVDNVIVDGFCCEKIQEQGNANPADGGAGAGDGGVEDINQDVDDETCPEGCGCYRTKKDGDTCPVIGGRSGITLEPCIGGGKCTTSTGIDGRCCKLIVQQDDAAGNADAPADEGAGDQGAAEEDEPLLKKLPTDKISILGISEKNKYNTALKRVETLKKRYENAKKSYLKALDSYKKEINNFEKLKVNIRADKIEVPAAKAPKVTTPTSAKTKDTSGTKDITPKTTRATPAAKPSFWNKWFSRIRGRFLG